MTKSHEILLLPKMITHILEKYQMSTKMLAKPSQIRWIGYLLHIIVNQYTSLHSRAWVCWGERLPHAKGVQVRGPSKMTSWVDLHQNCPDCSTRMNWCYMIGMALGCNVYLKTKHTEYAIRCKSCLLSIEITKDGEVYDSILDRNSVFLETGLISILGVASCYPVGRTLVRLSHINWLGSLASFGLILWYHPQTVYGEEFLLNFLIGLRSVPTWANVNIWY